MYYSLKRIEQFLTMHKKDCNSFKWIWTEKKKKHTNGMMMAHNKQRFKYRIKIDISMRWIPSFIVQIRNIIFHRILFVVWMSILLTRWKYVQTRYDHLLLVSICRIVNLWFQVQKAKKKQQTNNWKSSVFHTIIIQKT